MHVANIPGKRAGNDECVPLTGMCPDVVKRKEKAVRSVLITMSWPNYADWIKRG